MKTRKFRWLKRLGLISGGFLSVAFIGFLFLSEKKPKGETGAAAEALAQKIQQAIHQSEWDSTEAVQWTFSDRHSFLWDKKRHWVKVNWKSYEALIRIDSVDGRVWKDGKEIINPKKRQKLVKRGLYFWQNDSFWLNAPSKLFDKGTERRLVNYKGQEALLITYKLGGATPGDSYLWLVDENGLPTSWKLWVKIIPIGGVEFSWDNWITTETGAKIATLHKGLLNLKIENVKTGDLKSFSDKDPFAPITELSSISIRGVKRNLESINIIDC